MINKVVVVRGAGDIATGIIQKLFRAGFKVVAIETDRPSAIRRKVALCEAIYDGNIVVEDIEGILVRSKEEIFNTLEALKIPVIIDAEGELISSLKPIAVVDAIIAKYNIGTNRSMAPVTVGVGPGFKAGIDVDIVVETMRGHNLGRLIFEGEAIANTGVPGKINGFDRERVIHSPASGKIVNKIEIGAIVKAMDVLAVVDNKEVISSISGVLRGIIRDGYEVKKGMKIADIDPRIEEVKNCYTISDKARTIGGAVLEAVLYSINKMR
jgi:xanthine dehydrogenase accessory factor